MKTEVNSALCDVFDSVHGILTTVGLNEEDARCKVSHLSVAVNKVFEEASNSMSEEVMKIESSLDQRIAGLATKADLEIAVTRTLAATSELKSDISNLETKMDAGMVKMEAGFQADISNLKSEMDAGMVKMEAGMVKMEAGFQCDISNLKSEMDAGMVKTQADISNLKSELLASNNTQFMWLAGMLVAIAAILVGLEFFSKVLPG